MAADPHAHEAAARQRIVSHMNADHQDSVRRYLEHYCNVSSFAARNARLVGMSLGSMSIQAAGHRYNIPLEPPMQSWREARERVIKMDQDAVTALRRSDITVKTYTRPRGFHAVVFTVCSLTYVLVSRRANALPGSYIHDYILKYVPALASFTAKVQPIILVLMIVIHVFESSIMARKLGKHNVPFGGGLWWCWITSCFIEGFGALQRVDALVRKGRLEKEKAKH
ncbi:uncharacterized protein K452DRAFT_286109 [Aplosporella prunicola CBS 121167]|uniref:DUF2470 domain-containing protein n=1 Tax=Aplosporella prunicola CBS 121167 TaxID=1176127 RepID=A0A6A6BGJ4_9PEZI|nr:uncharacterized protein K452DRAFT_286109 [Aplosporella prunicola CBS 121167]KAF2143282.1 hypothetical protein K452DRAFT_286109 [Aplosporella prunicola CBS 121167]